MNIDQVLELLKERRETVPKPLRLPTEIGVKQAELDLGFEFPEQYRKFMLEASDVVYGTLEPGLVLPDLMPYICLRNIAKNGWAIGVPKEVLPFCSDNGNYFTLSQSGNIGYYDHDDSSHRESEAEFKDWVMEDWLEIEEST